MYFVYPKLKIVLHNVAVVFGIFYTAKAQTIQEQLPGKINIKRTAINPSFQKVKNNSSKIFLFLTISLLVVQGIIGQNNGDFRSSGTGDWQSNSSWQTYNGSSWIAATSYPGENEGTLDVTIQSGHTIYIITDFTSALMGDVIVNGTLHVGWTRNLQITLNTPLLYLNGGDLGFLHNKTELYLPTNAVIQIDNGGDIIGRCSNNTEIYIGGELTAVCRGGGGTVLTFGEVVAGGGTINSIITEPSISPYTSCPSQAVNLLGMFGGATTNVSYEWTVTDPSAVDVSILNSTGSLANNSSTTTATSFTPSINGNYLVSLSVTDGSYTNIESKTVIITDFPVETTGVTILQGGSGTLTSSTVCSASGTSTNFAGSGSNYSNGDTWSNTGNISSNDGLYSSVNGKFWSKYLNATNFGFNIPSNASIDGIIVSISRKSSGSGTYEQTIRVLKNLTAVGDNKAITGTEWTTSDTTITYGGSNELWGASFSAADINSNNFGVQLDLYNDVVRTAYIDYIQVTVNYTYGEISWYTTSSGGASIGTGNSFNPVGVIGSGLPDTNTPGTYTYYAECSSIPGCRTPTDFIITDPSPLTEGPGGVTSNLKLWLKANEGITKNGADGVTTWATQGKGSDATVNTTGQEPTFRDNATYNVNFNPVVEFSNEYSSVLKDIDFSFDNTSTQFLEGASGFYSQDIFVVIIPDDTPINDSFGFMDLFCADADLATPEEDATGIGIGDYSGRVDDEIIMYAHSTYSTGTPGDGYAVAEIGTGSSYDNVGIINAYNNLTLPQQELKYNANNVGNTQNNSIDDMINVSDTKFWIGRSEGWEASLNGRIAEVITYSSRKDDSNERNRIQSYLAIKYGITLGVNGTSLDYVDSSGALIWDINTGIPVEDVFNYNITGIGRDDVSELNQKQSKTVNTTDDITIGLNEIATTNNLNANTFTSNKTYLVWGNDNAVLTGQPAVIVDMSSGITPPITPDGTKVEFTPIGRKWKVASKGTNFSAKVSIPEALLIPLGPPPGDYLMFVSDSPVFNPTAEYRIMNSDGFGNFQTNYTFSGTKYITFGFAPEKKFVRSIQFDGVKDYLDAGDVLDINTPTTEFTISAWIKRENTSASIVSKRDNGFTIGYNFGINSSGNLEMSWNGGSETIASSVPIPVSKWHHVAVIYNGTNAKLYIDGVEDVLQTTALAAPIDNSESFLIAAADGDEVNTTSFFEGNIDEVRVWDIALTEDQLRFVMNQEIEDNTNVEGSYFTSLGITPTKNDIASIPWANLKGYYPMSAYTFTNCKDASGNGNTAALKNLNTVDYQTAPLPYFSATNGAWDTPATWLNNTEQNLPNSLSVVDGATRIDWNIVEISDNNILTSGSRDIKVLGLNIISNSVDGTDTKLTVDGDNATGTGNGLTVTHYLKLDGLIDLQGESQLIQTLGSDFDAVSIGIIERDQQGEFNRFRYNYWSSPVMKQGLGNASSTVDGNPIAGTSFSIGDVLRDGTNANSPIPLNYTAGYNGSLGIPITLSTAWMYKYANKSGAYSEWVHVGNTGPIYAGEGFIMKGVGDPDISETAQQNYVFEGKPNNGTITLTVTQDNSYLVGNPYPSAIDAYEFLRTNSPSGRNSIRGAIYFWEHYGGDSHILKDYQGGYAAFNFLGGAIAAASAHPDVSNLGTGTKIPGQYIPIGQSFYVVGEPGGVIEFNNGQRAFEKEGVATSVFMKNSNTKNKTNNNKSKDTRLKFRIGFDAPEINHRQLLLGFDENASDEVDWGYDAEIFEIFEDDMYWMIDDKKYIIQATNNFSLDKEIPLGIQTAKDGNISIKVDALENVAENISVYIKDNLTGETYDIKQQTFEVHLEAGEYKERFVLTFQPRLKTLEEIEFSLVEGIFVYMNNDISELQINRIVDTEIENISLFNYLGQQVGIWNSGINERFVSLPIKNATGVYILRVHTTAGILTKKIIIK